MPIYFQMFQMELIKVLKLSMPVLNTPYPVATA